MNAGNGLAGLAPTDRVQQRAETAGNEALADIDAERRLLGHLLLRPVSTADLPEASLFYSDRHRFIASQILLLIAEHGTACTNALRDHLVGIGKLQAVGGDEYLLSLTDTIPEADIGIAIAHLRKLQLRRKLVELAERLRAEGRAGDIEGAGATLALAKATIEKAADTKPAGVSPADIVRRWQSEGPLVRVPTGIAPLDELCLGGIPVPWRMMIVGAPAAGKTFVETAIADQLARSAAAAGLCVGILAVDEEPDDVTIRLAQIAGYTIAEAEARDPKVLAGMADALSALRLRFYDSASTIERAANELAAWAASQGRKAVLFLDSLHAVTSELARDATSPRELVEANVKAMRWAQDHHGLLVVATVEANRAAYRDDDAAETTNDMAAGAESRAIEYGAKTQLMLRTPKGHPDHVWVRVSKNRRGKRGEFFMKLDRETHTLSPCEDPRQSPEAAAKSANAKLTTNKGKVEADARTLLHIVLKSPGLGERGLRAAIKADGHSWGPERLDAARLVLVRGVDDYRLENRGERKANGEFKTSRWFVVPTATQGREE